MLFTIEIESTGFVSLLEPIISSKCHYITLEDAVNVLNERCYTT